MGPLKKSNIKVRSNSLEEVYKMLQLRMDHEMNIRNMKVIAFTSIVPCAGKSAHVYNIAVLMALEGKEVLVIDCNTDDTRLLHYFGIDKDALRKEGKGHNEYCRIIREVPGMSRLSFVSGSNGLQRPQGFLNTEKVSALIEQVKGEYNVILIDSPPVDIAAEGLKLSVIADGTILVVPSGNIPKASARRIREMLDSVSVTVLGVILEQQWD